MPQKSTRMGSLGRENQIQPTVNKTPFQPLKLLRCTNICTTGGSVFKLGKTLHSGLHIASYKEEDRDWQNVP